MKDLRKKAKKKVSHLMHLLIEQYGENVDQRFINAQWIRQGGKRAKEATEEDLEKKMAWLNKHIEQAKNETWQGWV